MRASTAIPVAEARVPIPTRRDLAPGDRDIYDDFEKVRKVPPSVIHRTLANAPSLLRAYMRISNELRYGTQLPGRIRELAIVAVGEVTGSIYEVTAHARFALQAGAQPEQLDELCHASASTVYDEIERAAVLYAAEITQHYRAGEGTLASLNARFDPVGKVELVLQVGFYNTVVRILGAFAIESNEAVHGASFRSNNARTPIERTAPSRHGADTLGSGEHPEAPLFAAMKAAPALARCYFDFGQAIVEDRAVSPALRELVTIIVLDVLDARAMATCHRARAETLGVSRDKLQSLASFATSAHFDESEHAALRFAVESTRHIHVAAETFRDLYRSFDLPSMTALTLLVAYYAGLALIAKTLIPEQA
jgi:alkylhydroperoxidase family enzyme